MAYEFRTVTSCVMCGSPSRSARALGRRLNRSQGAFPPRKGGVSTRVMRCGGCGLHYSDPLPIPTSIEDHYGMPPEDYWSPSYFAIGEGHFRGQLGVYRKLAGDPGGRKALDVGAGIGKTMVVLARAGFDTFGVEPSSAFRDRAIERMGIPEDRIHHASAESASFEPGTFDFVTFGAVLEHLYDPAGALRAALAWLRPGGLIQAEVPSSKWLVAKLANLFYRLTLTDFVANLSPMHPPYHLYEFTLESFRRFARKNACELAHLRHFVCETFLPKILDPVLTRVMAATRTGMDIEVWLRKS